MNRLLLLTMLIVAPAATGDERPRHIADMERSGFLAAPSGDPPELVSVAGPRFLELVPDSQKEVCRINLEYYARVKRGLYRLRVVDQRGRAIMECSL